MQPALLDELTHVRQLAFVHPFPDEPRIQAVESEDDELLLEFFRRPPRPARDRQPDADGEQDEGWTSHGVSGMVNYSTRGTLDRVGRVLAIDVGGRRIGLAISDPSRTLARPLSTLTVSSAEDGVARVAQEIARLSAELDHDDDALAEIVVGAPTRLDGSASDQTSRVDAFVEALRARTTLPIVREDERLTSREAESRLAVGERDWRRRKARLDAAAAAIILQDYLDRQ